MTELLLTLISTALINNLVLHWPLGVDPVLGSADKRKKQFGHDLST